MSAYTDTIERQYRYESAQADARDRQQDAQRRAEAELAFKFSRAIANGDPDATPQLADTVPDSKLARELGIEVGSPSYPRRRLTVAEALEDALDYPTGPGMADVVRVLSLAMRCNDPMVALVARQLVDRCAAKFAEHHTGEVIA